MNQIECITNLKRAMYKMEKKSRVKFKRAPLDYFYLLLYINI